MVKALKAGGFEFHIPQGKNVNNANYNIFVGTFYILVKCPIDEKEFVDKLADHDVYVLGGQRATNNAPGMNDAKNKAQ